MSQNDYIKDITFTICNRPCGSLNAWDDWGHSVSVTELGLEFQSSHPHSWALCLTFQEAWDVVSVGSHLFLIVVSEVFVIYSLARLTRAMFFPPSLSLMNLWLSLPPKTLPITFPALLEIHAFVWCGEGSFSQADSSTGNESVLWIANNFDGLLLFWYLSDGLSQTIVEGPGSEEMELSRP